MVFLKTVLYTHSTHTALLNQNQTLHSPSNSDAANPSLPSHSTRLSRSCYQFSSLQAKMFYDVNSPLFRSFLSQKGGSSDKRVIIQHRRMLFINSNLLC
ncbi:hypothetical protein Hdeb2414_s0006g00195581 [Helianthus debilis subsp. tardiflorus]